MCNIKTVIKNFHHNDIVFENLKLNSYKMKNGLFSKFFQKIQYERKKSVGIHATSQIFLFDADLNLSRVYCPKFSYECS